jgi:hypothetical protein
MMPVTIHETALTQGPMARLPIFFLLETNCTNGIAAKGSWIDKITWLKTRSLSAPFSP